MNYSVSNVLPFTYLFPATALTASLGSTNQTTLTLAQDSYFELSWFLASVTGAAGALTDITPNYFSFQVTDQSTGRQLSSALIPQAVGCSNATAGYTQERYPITFSPGSVLAVSFSNLTTSAITIYLAAKGYKNFSPQK